MSSISAPVGKGVAPFKGNFMKDVVVVQSFLNTWIIVGKLNGWVKTLALDGSMGPRTIEAIVFFQEIVLQWKNPDGRIDPGGQTAKALFGPIIYRDDLGPSKWKKPTAPPISHVEYVRWVKASLNRLLGAVLLNTGSITEEYRNKVKEFQTNQFLIPDGKVDEATQNALMRLNRLYPDYVNWVQRALVRSGEADGKLAVSDYWNDLTEEILKDFQTNEGLKADGWVGAKTETALYNRTRIRVPGRLDKPKPYDPVKPPLVWQDSLAPDLRMNVWLNSMIIERTGNANPEFYCMMQKLAKPQSNLFTCLYVTDTNVKDFIDEPLWARHPSEFASDARLELLTQTKLAQRQTSIAKGWANFQSAVLQIDKQIATGLVKLGLRATEDIMGSGRNLKDMLKWVQETQSKSRNILSCYPKVRP